VPRLDKQMCDAEFVELVLPAELCCAGWIVFESGGLLVVFHAGDTVCVLV
jgi:hypothetical protein